jgi:hypothetical protein
MRVGTLEFDGTPMRPVIMPVPEAWPLQAISQNAYKGFPGAVARNDAKL